MKRLITLAAVMAMAVTTAWAGEESIPTEAGSVLSDGTTYNVTSNTTISKTDGLNGLVVADGATVTINIESGCTLTVYGADGNGQTAGKAGILLPSNSTLKVTGQGSLIAYGGNAGNGANGGKGYATYHGKSYNNLVNFTTYPGSGGNGGGGAGAAIGTDGSNGANGQSVGDHKYWDWFTDNTRYISCSCSSCLSPALQESADASSCGALVVSEGITTTLTGGSAGTSGSIGEQGGCATDKGSGYACDVRCGAGGAGGGGGAGAAGAGYGKGGQGGQGGSCGKCGDMRKCAGGADGGNSAVGGTSAHQGAQGTTGNKYADAQNISYGIIYCNVISFDANEGTGEMASQTIEGTGTLTANTLTREGYTFTGWNTDADGNGTAYTDEQAITVTKETKGAITLYAQWEEKADYTWVFTNTTLENNQLADGGVVLSNVTKVDNIGETLWIVGREVLPLTITADGKTIVRIVVTTHACGYDDPAVWIVNQTEGFTWTKKEQYVAEWTGEATSVAVGGTNSYIIDKIEVWVKKKSTAIDNIDAHKTSGIIKTIENGKVVIIKEGVKYDLMGRKI